MMTTIPTEYLVRVRCAPGSVLPKGSVKTWVQTGNREQAQQAADDYAATQRRIGRHVTDVMVSRDVATLPVGAYVRVREDIDIWPLGLFPAGLLGEVTGSCLTNDDDQPIDITLTKTFEVLDEWDNALQVWLDGTDQSVCTMSCFEVVATRESLTERMRAAGFDDCSTGGGCTAWRKTLSPTTYQLICTDGQDIYGHPDADVWIIGSYYDPPTGFGGFVNCNQSMTLDQALAHIDRLPTPKDDEELMLGTLAEIGAAQ